jgi:hypothetical protein
LFGDEDDRESSGAPAGIVVERSPLVEDKIVVDSGELHVIVQHLQDAYSTLREAVSVHRDLDRGGGRYRDEGTFQELDSRTLDALGAIERAWRAVCVVTDAHEAQLLEADDAEPLTRPKANTPITTVTRPAGMVAHTPCCETTLERQLGARKRVADCLNHGVSGRSQAIPRCPAPSRQRTSAWGAVWLADIWRYGVLGSALMRTTRLRVREVDPMVVRVIDVPAACTLAELHELLQAAIGWTDSHLHEFHTCDGRRFGVPDDDDGCDDLGPQLADETTAGLGDLGAQAVYLYDYGDHWEHDITVLGTGAHRAGCVYGEGYVPTRGRRRTGWLRRDAGRAGRPDR